MKQSCILTDKALQSILLPPSWRTRHRKDLPETTSKVDTSSSINYRNYYSQSPNGCQPFLAQGGHFIHSTKERREKNPNAKIVYTVVLLKTNYHIMFVQKPGI